MASSNLEAMIKKEQGNLERYKAKKAEYEAKIKATESRLAELNMMRDSQQLNQIANMMSQGGLTIADLMTAMQNGDMLTLQEKMDAAQAAQIKEGSGDDTDATDNHDGM